MYIDKRAISGVRTPQTVTVNMNGGSPAPIRAIHAINPNGIAIVFEVDQAEPVETRTFIVVPQSVSFDPTGLTYCGFAVLGPSSATYLVYEA